MLSFAHLNTAFARGVWTTLFVLVLVWIEKYMGGFASGPEDTGPNLNDTSRLFNWHPFLMILAFPVCMTEALFAYTALPGTLLPRQGHVQMLRGDVLHPDCAFAQSPEEDRSRPPADARAASGGVRSHRRLPIAHGEETQGAGRPVQSPQLHGHLRDYLLGFSGELSAALLVRSRRPACAVPLWRPRVCPSDSDASAEGSLRPLSPLLWHGSVSRRHGHDHGRTSGEVDVQSEGWSAHRIQGIL